MTNKQVPDEVRKFFSEIGKKSGNKLKRERGSEYFSKISKMRKTFGRQAKPKVDAVTEATPSIDK